MDFESGHFSHRWHHHGRGHEGCDHAPASGSDHLGRMGAILSAGRIVGSLGGVAWTVYAVRHMGADWGRLATILAYASVASIGTDMGIPLALTKLACRYPTLERGAVIGAIRRRTFAGTVAALALVIAWYSTKDGSSRWGLALLYGLSVTVTPISGSLLALLRGKAIAAVEAIYDAGRQILLPILGIAAIESGLGLVGVLLAYVAVDVGSASVILHVSRRRLNFSGARNADEEEELRFRETIPLSASTLVGTAYERVDSAMLAPLAGTTAVGIYRMISPLYGAALMWANATGDTAVIAAGRASSGDARATVTKLALRAAAVTVPIAVVLAIFGPAALPHVLHVKATPQNPHPIQWSAAATPLRILMAASIPSALLAVLTPVALTAPDDHRYAGGRPKRVFRFALAALLTNMALNLLLVPHWAAGLGMSGAATAFLITESLLAVALWTVLPSPSSRSTPPLPAPQVEGLPS